MIRFVEDLTRYGPQGHSRCEHLTRGATTARCSTRTRAEQRQDLVEQPAWTRCLATFAPSERPIGSLSALGSGTGAARPSSADQLPPRAALPLMIARCRSQCAGFGC